MFFMTGHYIFQVIAEQQRLHIFWEIQKKHVNSYFLFVQIQQQAIYFREEPLTRGNNRVIRIYANFSN